MCPGARGTMAQRTSHPARRAILRSGPIPRRASQQTGKARLGSVQEQETQPKGQAIDARQHPKGRRHLPPQDQVHPAKSGQGEAKGLLAPPVVAPGGDPGGPPGQAEAPGGQAGQHIEGKDHLQAQIDREVADHLLREGLRDPQGHAPLGQGEMTRAEQAEKKQEQEPCKERCTPAPQDRLLRMNHDRASLDVSLRELRGCPSGMRERTRILPPTKQGIRPPCTSFIEENPTYGGRYRRPPRPRHPLG